LGCLASRVLKQSTTISYLTLSVVVGTLTNTHSYDTPILSNARLNWPRSGGLSVTALGSNFLGYDATSTVSVALFDCLTSSWTSNTGLRCDLGRNWQVRSVLQATVAGVVGTSSTVFTFDGPVGSIGWLNSALTSVTAINVLGMQFGPVDFTPSAQLETLPCLTSAWSSSTTIQCTNANELQRTLADKVGAKALRVFISVAAIPGTSSRVFTFDGPTLSAGFLNAPFSGRASVTVTGLNFGSYDFTASSFNHGILCLTHAWGSSTSVICQGAVAVFTIPQVVMTVAAVSGTGMSLFTCDGTASFRPSLP
jgi:hypothetical protein